MSGNVNRLRLGYACAWWHPREQTWSYCAIRLRRALDALAEVEDIEAQRTLGVKAMLWALSAPRPGVPWQYSKLERKLIDRAVRRAAGRLRPDAVLGIGQVDTPTSVPTFLYQDTNAAAELAYRKETGLLRGNLLPSRLSLLESWAGEQVERSRRAAGIFTWSHWYADFLVRQQGVRRERVVVLPPGMNSTPTVHRDPERPAAGRVIFVGTDFQRKGGDLVVDAVARLNRSGDKAVRLTVIGPQQWPLPGDPPDFVDFVGLLSPAQVAASYAAHDVFAMPSRFEAFGIVLTEALAAGLPCVARRAFAMPEIVEEGVTGALVGSDDPDALAAALDRVLRDSEIFGRVAAARPRLLARYNWETVATSMVEHMTTAVGHG